MAEQGGWGGFDWSVVADAWDELHAVTEAATGVVTERLIALSDPQPGERGLEVGAGVGEFGAKVAGLVAPDGHVVITDSAEGMLAVAKRRITERGLANVEIKQLDAQSLSEPDASFDFVFSQMTYMLLLDPGAGFTEAARVLRPGGRFAFAVWGPPQHNPWSVSLGMAVNQAGVPGLESANPFGPGGLFSLADEARLRDLLEGAGFEVTSIEAVDHVHRFVDIDDYWSKVPRLAGPLAVLISGLSDGQRADVRSHLDGLLSTSIGDDGLELSGQALCVLART